MIACNDPATGALDRGLLDHDPANAKFANSLPSRFRNRRHGGNFIDVHHREHLTCFGLIYASPLISRNQLHVRSLRAPLVPHWSSPCGWYSAFGRAVGEAELEVLRLDHRDDLHTDRPYSLLLIDSGATPGSRYTCLATS